MTPSGIRAMLCLPALLALSGGLARADEKSDQLLKAAGDVARKLDSIQARFTQQSGNATYEGVATLARPNKVRVETKGPSNTTFVSDGKQNYSYQASRNTYTQSAVDPSRRVVTVGAAIPLRIFFTPDEPYPMPDGTVKSYVGAETLDGVSYEVVQAKLPTRKLALPLALRLGGDAKPAPAPTPVNVETTVRFYFSPTDQLIHRMTIRTKLGERESITTYAIKGVELNPRTPADRFAFAPPPGAQLYKPPTLADYAAGLVAVDKNAPDFQLPTPDGERLALSDYVKKSKVTLINFWFYN